MVVTVERIHFNLSYPFVFLIFYENIADYVDTVGISFDRKQASILQACDQILETENIG